MWANSTLFTIVLELDRDALKLIDINTINNADDIDQLNMNPIDILKTKKVFNRLRDCLLSETDITSICDKAFEKLKSDIKVRACTVCGKTLIGQEELKKISLSHVMFEILRLQTEEVTKYNSLPNYKTVHSIYESKI